MAMAQIILQPSNLSQSQSPMSNCLKGFMELNPLPSEVGGIEAKLSPNALRKKRSLEQHEYVQDYPKFRVFLKILEKIYLLQKAL